MELRFTDHARQRMQRRGIDEAEVAEVLDSPRLSRPAEERADRLVVIGTTPAGRTLMVVVTTAEPTAVVTVAERGPAPRR